MLGFVALFDVLNKNNVQYLVAGGVAVNLYGIERATADIDLVVYLESENLGRFIDVMKGLGFKPKIPVRFEEFADAKKRKLWIQEKGIEVFSIFDPKNPFLLLDVFIKPPFDFPKAYASRKTIRAGRVSIPVVSIQRLIDMKKKAGRPQDLADVYHLQKIRKEWSDE